MTNSDTVTRLAKLLSDPAAASLVLAGLSVMPSDHVESCFSIGKPQSTLGNSIPNYETGLIRCDVHTQWGGICFDAPILNLRLLPDFFVVEHLVVFLGGTNELIDNPGSFRESFNTLSDAIDFIFRFYFRNHELFSRLSIAL